MLMYLHPYFVLRALRALDPTSVPPAANRRQDRPSKPDGLTKQTYSTLVYLPGTSTPRKWHIVAYFQVREHDTSRHKVSLMCNPGQ